MDNPNFVFPSDAVLPDVEVEPAGHVFNFIFGDYTLVGHGAVTSPSCDKWLGFSGCLN